MVFIKRQTMVVSLLAATILLTASSQAQTPALTCTIRATGGSLVRADGLAELVSELLLECSGGSPGTLVTTDISVHLNTSLTSKVEGGWSEALLVVDDPAPASQVPGVNVFQAVPVAANQLRFGGVSFTAPGSGTRRFWILNIRANANQLGISATAVLTQIVAFVSATAFSINNPQQTVAFVYPDLTATIRDATDTANATLSFPQCTGQNTALVTNPAAPGGTVSFNVKFKEGFATAFLRRTPGPPDAPQAQDVPGARPLYGSETGFYNPAFPSTNGLNIAGLASQGTRLMIKFTNVPPGLRLYVTTTPSPFGTSSDNFGFQGIGTSGARLVQTDSMGAGPYTPIAATTTVLLNSTPVEIAPVTLVDGAGSAVWEILSANPLVVEQVSFGVLVAYESNTVVQGSFFMARALAPLTSASAVVPRFVEPWDSASDGKASIASCDGTRPDLVITSFTAPASAAAGDSIPFSLTVKNQGTAASGRLRVRVSLYSDPALASPLGFPVSWCSTPPVLNPFETHSCSGNLPIPSSFAAAPYYLGAVADDQLAITESNEANNSVASALALSGCTISLGATSATVPPAGGNGYIPVSGPQACTAPVASSAPWITITSYATVSAGGQVLYSVAPNASAASRIGTLTVAGQVFTVMQAGSTPMKIGIYRTGNWQLDLNGNGTLDSGSDRNFFLGWAGATIVTGDWNGDGKTKAGVYSNGYWFLDYDGNGLWDNGVIDKVIAWGWTGATPVVGDWNGDGKTNLGVYSNGFWFLDYNGDYLWDAGVVDKQVGWGWAGVTPLVGDWNGNGKAKIGVYVNGFWFLDYNGDYLWDGGTVDKQVGWGWAGVTPIVGDWNGDGRTKIGVYAGGYWYLDYDGNYLWQYPASDQIWALGWTGTTPVMGDWNGDGKTKAGAFINGYWYLDYNGNGVFDGAGTDRILAFGAAGDTPVVGRW